MTAESLRTIVNGLNNEPFNMNLNLISFDSISSIRLIQLLSDVLQWINDAESIDIRDEAPDETALRIFHLLRLLKYRPPNDIDQLQEWRRGIVEGEKTAINPILEWIFKDTESLKERAYLAKYLTAVEVPGEFQDSEIVELQNEVARLMDEFKEIHSQVIERRKDTLLAEDIRSDLKAMQQEKDQLNRRIEKIKHKLRLVGNLENYLQLAAKCREENEKNVKIALHRQEQRNALVHNEQKLQRLNATLKEVIATADNIDPTEAMNRLKEEMATTRYMIEEKLPKEIEAKRIIVAELSKVADMPAIDENDIAELQQKIDKINKEIVEMIDERDKRDETIDKLSIYRHQATAIARKKSALAEKLQELRSELQHIESMIEEKKKELREKSGGEDVITSVQFKNYVNKLRSKTTAYKRKRAETDGLKSENLILARTYDILNGKWIALKEQIEESGGRVSELDIAKQYERPKTAKPSSDNINELKGMIKELSEKLEQKRALVSELIENGNQLNEKFNELNNQYNSKKRNYETMMAS
uniref:Intraflagellar transport protein 81 homolog n=1 Tax=Parascaris univalens TaxID=6257 RepID=A0A914ZDU7_PARUN